MGLQSVKPRAVKNDTGFRLTQQSWSLTQEALGPSLAWLTGAAKGVRTAGGGWLTTNRSQNCKHQRTAGEMQSMQCSCRMTRYH